jgi:hypothetical protein
MPSRQHGPEPKLIRDPIFDYISIDRGHDAWLLELIDTPEVQRLRRIHQLGVSHFVYPGAEHTRFSHTLGMLHLMQEATEHLQRHDGRLDEQGRRALLAAAVLHDVGHGPFSHLLESRLGKGHENWSEAILADEDTAVHAILDREGLLADVLALIRKGEWPRARWQKLLISSQLDLDRMDYLLRDSYFTGAGFGEFDWYRLIHTMRLEEAPPIPGQAVPVLRFEWPEKAKDTLEQYIFARFYMYQGVYLHHCTRGYEKLLLAIWDRARRLSQKRKSLCTVPVLKPFLTLETQSVSEYLRLGECHILSQIEAWQCDKDSVLSDLCGRFHTRRGFKKVMAASALTGKETHARVQRVLDYLKTWGDVYAKDPDSYILEDRGGVQAYKPYRAEESESGDPPIYLHGHGEISQVLKRLKAVSDQKEEFDRYYTPAEHRDAVARILGGSANP